MVGSAFNQASIKLVSHFNSLCDCEPILVAQLTRTLASVVNFVYYCSLFVLFFGCFVPFPPPGVARLALVRSRLIVIVFVGDELTGVGRFPRNSGKAV